MFVLCVYTYNEHSKKNIKSDNDFTVKLQSCLHINISHSQGMGVNRFCQFQSLDYLYSLDINKEKMCGKVPMIDICKMCHDTFHTGNVISHITRLHLLRKMLFDVRFQN